MINLRSIKLRNILYYKDTEFNLDRSGITVIMGLNKSSTSRNRRNGSGKSLLVSTIPHLRYPHPIIGTPKGERHSLLSEDDSSITWNLSIEDTNWLIEKFRKGKGVQWNLSKDGTELNPQTATIAQEMVQSMIPLSEEEFYTTVYLDSRRQSTLLHGTATQRQEYITSLFNLHDFQSIRNYFGKILNSIKESEIRRDALKESMEPYEWLDSFDIKQEEKELDTLLARTSKLSNTLSEIRENETTRDLIKKFEKEIRDAKKHDQPKLERYRKLKSQWDRFDAHVDVISEYETEIERHNEFQSFIKDFAERWIGKGVSGVAYEICHAILQNMPLREVLRKFISALRDEVSEFRKSLEEYKEKSKEFSILDEKRKESEKILREITGFVREGRKKVKILPDLEMSVYKLKTMVEHLSNTDKEECEYCGSQLTKKQIQSRLRDATTNLKTLTKELKSARGFKKIFDEADELYMPKRDEAKLFEFRQLPRPDKAGRTNASFLKAFEQIDIVDEPKQARSVPQPTVSKATVNKKLKFYERFKSASDSIKPIRKDIGRWAEEMDEIQASIKKKGTTEKQLREAEERKAEISQNIKLYRSNIVKLMNIRKEIKQLDSTIGSKKVAELLFEAYGNKGLKLLVIKDIAKRIEHNLNVFAPLLFPENFKFMTYADINVMEITAERPDGRVSDIRYLSGAEGRMFMLLWLVALLPMIPDNRRFNTVVLDEFEAGIDKTTKGMILNDYLPKLNEIVPHIVFVTPYKIEPALNRKVITAVKEGDTTTLVEN